MDIYKKRVLFKIFSVAGIVLLTAIAIHIVRTKCFVDQDHYDNGRNVTDMTGQDSTSAPFYHDINKKPDYESYIKFRPYYPYQYPDTLYYRYY